MPTDQMIYDDTYRISLHSLIESHRPKSVYDLKKLLDSNGYIGRYKISVVRNNGYKTNELALRIYLPESRIYYRYFNRLRLHLTEGYIDRRRYRPISWVKSDYIEKIMHLILRYNYASQFDVSREFPIDNKTSERIISGFNNFGILMDGSPIYRTKMDATEIYHNVLELL